MSLNKSKSTLDNNPTNAESVIKQPLESVTVTG